MGLAHIGNHINICGWVQEKSRRVGKNLRQLGFVQTKFWDWVPRLCQPCGSMLIPL